MVIVLITPAVVYGKNCCGPCDTYYDGSCDCTRFPPRKSCLEFYQLNGLRVTGRYRLMVNNYLVTVICDQETMGGGWTVIQRREDGSINFNRNWSEYKFGFGELTGDMWLGNELIHQLTKSSAAPKKSELLINMRKNNDLSDGIAYYAKYDTFKIDNEASRYILDVSGPSGDAPYPSGLLYQRSRRFSTKDMDNDYSSQKHCGDLKKGGWWFGHCLEKMYLNGLYKFVNAEDAIAWHYNSTVHPEFVEMKIRPNL